MKFVCDKCGAQYKIKDEKIGPNGVSVRCKKCEHKIIVRLPKKEPEFPEFPSDVGSVPSDMEETRQMANPLVLQQQEAQEGGDKKPKEKALVGESVTKNRTKAVQKSPSKEASNASEKSGVSEEKSSAHLSGEWGDLPPSENAGAVSSLPFDLGLGKDEALNQALDPVLGEEKADSHEDSSPFGAISSSFGTDDGDGDAGDGNATRVVNLAAMASLMKATVAPEPEAPSSFSPPPEASSAQTPGEEWFVAIDGQQRGPMDFEGIRAHWNRGEISAESLVWNAGMADWAALGTVPELSKRLEPPKPAMSDIPGPAVASDPKKVDEWGLPVAEKALSSASIAASLPSPQAASDAPAWKPAAASMLSSLLQDEMSAMDELPAPAPAASASMAPAPAPVAMPVSAVPQPALPQAPASALPELAPLPAPSQIPVPQAVAGSFPLVPPSSQDAFSPEVNEFQAPLPSLRQPSDGPLPAIGIDPALSSRDSTMPDASSAQDEEFEGNNWDLPAALPTHQDRNRHAGRSKQAGSRRQDNNRRAHNMTIQQPLPQMPSKSSGMSKGLLGIGIVALLVALALVALKLTSTEAPDVVAQAPVPLAPQNVPPTPVAPPSASAAPATTPTPADSNLVSASAPVAQVAQVPSNPDSQQVASKTAMEAEAPAPSKEVVEPASPKNVSSGSEKKIASNKKVKKSRLKKPKQNSKVNRVEEEEFEEEEEEEESAPVVASAPPKPEPPKAEPASKVDDDFERLFGGGSSPSASVSAPSSAKKPTVYVPPPTGGTTKTTLSQSDIMGEVVKHRGAIKRCTDDEEDSDTIVMVWVIQKSGKPSGIKTASASYQGSDLEECLKGVINNMKFPAYSGTQMQPIKFPFKF